MKELNLIFQNPNINDVMTNHQIQQPHQQPISPATQLKIINDPQLFSGYTKDLDGFLTRVELAIEVNPHRFPDDRRRVMFVISYLTGKALNWASCLRRNNSPVLGNYENFIC